jgi:carbonic anhydrase/acetyltransferase-like protein (isoleucine patch superfamily)
VDDLLRSLTRARDALAKEAVGARSQISANSGDATEAASLPAWAVTAIGTVALLLIVLGVVFHNHGALKLGIVLAAVGGGLFVTGQLKSRGSTPGISMGASVGRGAEVDPTAAIEIGAAVGSRARVGPGAVVRVGANVGSEAVVEASAVISYGASIGRGAIVGEGAVVGAGSDVARGAHVPAGMVLRPGSSFKGGGDEPTRFPREPRHGTRSRDVQEACVGPGQRSPEPAKAEPDPRAVRVGAACARLDEGLRDSPQAVRDLLGSSGFATVKALRRTCEDLLVREAALRREAEFGQLPAERLAIEQRIEREADGQIRESLRGALAAIDGQVKERERLRLAADRIAAEHMRLLYTLEELAAQLARLRSAGDGARQAAAEVPVGVAQLRTELEAIADALESVSAPAARPDDERADPAAPPPIRVR